jgi:hypothetical protein
MLKRFFAFEICSETAKTSEKGCLSKPVWNLAGVKKQRKKETEFLFQTPEVIPNVALFA